MSTTTVREFEGELVITVPRTIVDELHLQPGVTLELETEQTHIKVRQQRPRHSLEQLLKEHAEIQDQLDPNREWVDAPRVGREII